MPTLDPHLFNRLSGIYGATLPDFLAETDLDELQPLAHTPYTLAELRWAIRHEMIWHLPDLLLRRTRLGLVSPEGGLATFEIIKPLMQQELNWSEKTWRKEIQDYTKLWKDCYSIPSK